MIAVVIQMSSMNWISP